MILVTLLRLMMWPVEEFDTLEGLTFCEFVVLERLEDDANFQVAFSWGLGQEKDLKGLRRKKGKEKKQEVWDGDPGANLLTSTPKKVAPVVQVAQAPASK